MEIVNSAILISPRNFENHDSECFGKAKRYGDDNVDNDNDDISAHGESEIHSVQSNSL